MNDLVSRGPKVDRIARFQSLQSGHYWRARKAVPGECIAEGEVLLIQSIRWVEDTPHTVILRAHPRKIGADAEVLCTNAQGERFIRHTRFTEHRFLLEDFLNTFDFEPDADQVRAREVADVQGQIAQLQRELVDTQGDPAKLAAVVSAGLEKLTTAAQLVEPSDLAMPSGTALVTQETVRTLTQGSVATVLASGVTPALIEALKGAASHEHQIATIKAQWIQGKTSEIAVMLKALSPFYEEQAAAALAMTEDVRSYVDKLMQGIGSLDLYVGKGVEVQQICDGEDAPETEPLTLVQRKLLMDEELALWADVGEEFDFSRESRFFDALREHPSLIAQIFPTARCVLVMAATRREIDYGDPWVTVAKRAENRKVFLLIRNGGKIYRVFSPVESHLGAARLFPSTNDLDQIFRGLNGESIRFEDVAYTDHLSVQDKLSLHYKRFLLLACGLDHRLKLFGTFYPANENVKFLSAAFQERYCRYLIDDVGSGNLLAEHHPAVMEWIATKNAYLRSGSRVLCQHLELMDPTTAPGVCKNSRRDRVEWRYHPQKSMEVLIARREGDELIVEAQVSGHTQRDNTERTFAARVSLTAAKGSQFSSGRLAYLCLDAVTPAEIAYYLGSRENRRDHLVYIRFFKHALAHLNAERQLELPAREALKRALVDGRIASGLQADQIIEQAVIAWRAAQGGKSLPDPAEPLASDWKSLLDQMYMLAGEGSRQVREVETLLESKGLAPLRLVLSGRAKLIAYAAPAAAECDDRLELHAWVHRITLHRGKTALTEKGRRWATLPHTAAAETTVHEWEAAAQWANRTSVFGTYAQKQGALARTLDFADRLAEWRAPVSEPRWRELFSAWRNAREDLVRKTRYVTNPELAIPFGVRTGRREGFGYLAVGTKVPHALLYRLAPDEAARCEVRSAFVSPYANKTAAREQFDYAVARSPTWCLFQVSEEFATTRHGHFFAYEWGVKSSALRQELAPDPRLAPWFEAWRRAQGEDLRVWFAPGVLVDEGGRRGLVADRILGIELPADYAPTTVYEVTLIGEGRAPKDTPTHWFDLVPTSVEKYDATSSWGGISYQSHIEPTWGEALAAMRRAASERSGGITLTPASELPLAAQPPAGITRWYCVT